MVRDKKVIFVGPFEYSDVPMLRTNSNGTVALQNRRKNKKSSTANHSRRNPKNNKERCH